VWTQVCHEEERAVRELERVKADAEEARKATYEKARHEAETIESEHCERKQCLESEVERLKQELQSRRAQNYEREQQEKKRKERSETQLHEWKKQYNKLVGEKDRLISEIQSERDVVNKKLEELEVKHSQLRE
jgi:chromosome segregation ATPase